MVTYFKDQDILPHLIQLINKAEKELRISGDWYTLPEINIVVKEALLRGILVRILSYDIQIYKSSNLISESLCKNGSKIYFWNPDISGILHHYPIQTYLIVDSELLIITYDNWTKHASEYSLKEPEIKEEDLPFLSEYPVNFYWDDEDKIIRREIETFEFKIKRSILFPITPPDKSFMFNVNDHEIIIDQPTRTYKYKSNDEIFLQTWYNTIKPFSEGLAAVEYSNKWGFINKTGEEVIRINFDEVGFFCESLAPVCLQYKWGFIDKNGKNVVQIEYENVWLFSEGIAKVKMNGKYGFINTTGIVVSPIQYDSEYINFIEGVAKVLLNYKFGFIDKSGKEIIPIKYDSADDFIDGLARVKLYNKWGFINQKGVAVIPIKYDDASIFIDGYSTIRIDNKRGKIDLSGKEYWKSINSKIDLITSINLTQDDDIIRFWEQGFCGFYNKQNDLTICVPKYDDSLPISEGMIPVKLNGLWGFIDKTGHEIISLRYDYVSNFIEGLARVKLNLSFGFINTEGREVIPIEFDEADDFSEGLSRVQLCTKYCYYDIYTGEKEYFNPDDSTDIIGRKFVDISNINYKSGYIDKLGNVIIPYIYDSAEIFSEGLAKVVKDGQLSFIDIKGQTLFHLEGNYHAYSFKNGRCKVGFYPNTEYPQFSDLKHGFIDFKGKLVIPPLYDDAGDFNEDLAWVKLDYKFGYIDLNGNEIIPLKYDNAYSFNEGIACINYKGEYGFIDKIGRKVIPKNYDKFYSNIKCLINIGDPSQPDLSPYDFSLSRFTSLFTSIGFYSKSIYSKIKHTKSDLPFLVLDEGLVMFSSNSKYGYIINKEKIVIPLKYTYSDRVSIFSLYNEGMTLVRIVDGCYGFIDKAANEIVPLIYSSNGHSFCNGIAAVEMNKEMGFINKYGEVVIDFKYSWIGNFVEGKVKATSNHVDLPLKLDREGNEYFEHPYEYMNTKKAKD